jgi:hypothetical protein
MGFRMENNSAGLVSVAQRREGEDGPDCAVRVLAAVLPDARQIPLHIAGIDVGMVERRSEQQDESVTASDEELLHCGHGLLRMIRIGRSRQDAPRLRDRVDPALGVCRGAERRAVVEEGPAVPVAIPTIGLERLPERRHLDSPPLRIRALGAGLGPGREGGKDGVQEPTQPDALASTLATDPVHAVVPVAATDQRESVSTDCQAPLDGRHAVVEK